MREPKINIHRVYGFFSSTSPAFVFLDYIFLFCSCFSYIIFSIVSFVLVFFCFVFSFHLVVVVPSSQHVADDVSVLIVVVKLLLCFAFYPVQSDVFCFFSPSLVHNI